MDDQDDQTPDHESFAAFEDNLFEALSECHQRITATLRGANLDESNLKVASKRISQLLKEATAEMKASKRFNVRDRLDKVCEEVESLVAELSQLSHQDGNE